MPSTSILTFKWQIKGRPEGGSDQGSFVQRNSTGVDDALETTATTAMAVASSMVPPNNTRFMAIFPPSTNGLGLRLSGSTLEAGIPLSSHGMSLVCVTTGSTYYLWTTGSSAVSGVRVLWF